MCCVHIKHMFIQMRVANTSENNCSVCQLSAPKHHLTAPQTNIWCTCGNGDTIFAEKKKKAFSRVEPKEELIGASKSKRKTKGRQMLLFNEAGSCRLPPSSSLQPLTLRVSLFITSHQLERFQSTARTHWHAHTKHRMGGPESERKEEGPNEHWGGSLKTSREGWGSEKGTNMLDWKKGKGLEKRHWRKSTYDANGGIHSTLNSQGHICHFELCLRRKWKHKEAKTSEVQKSRHRGRWLNFCNNANNVNFVTPGWCWWHKRLCFCNEKKNAIILGYSVG